MKIYSAVMFRYRTFKAFTTFGVIFFLTFLGMRIQALDKHHKPRPRPRAVLNCQAKAASNSLLPASGYEVPPLAVIHEHSLPLIHGAETIAAGTSFSLPSAFPTNYNPTQGRSPPVC